MKRIKTLLLILLCMLFIDINVYAASGSLTTNKGSVYVGDSFTVSVNVDSMAAWNIHVTASGPVSDCTINEADASSTGTDISKTFSATCTATGEGTITLHLTGDITSAVDGNAVNLSDTKTVSVTTRPVDTRSSNVNLSSLSVDGYELVKVDNKNYTLTVPYDVTSINVNATAADSKTSISGNGNHELSIGENNIAIILTAENGAKNQINITVTRKEGYYLEDLDIALTKENSNIIVDNNVTLTSDILTKVKDSKKVVSFSYYDENKVLVYSYIIDGSKLSNTNDIVLNVSNDTENKSSILKLSNYADGIFESINKIDNEGISLKVYVGNKYTDEDKVNVYGYLSDTNKLELLNTNLEISEGYLTFNLGNSLDYFITLSTISGEVVTTKCNNNMPLIIVLVIIILLLIGVIVYLYLKKNKKKEEVKEIKVEEDNNIVEKINIVLKDEEEKELMPSFSASDDISLPKIKK